MCIGSAVVRVTDSYSCVLGSNPSQGNHIKIRYALNYSTQFISDESSVQKVLHLCEHFRYIFFCSLYKKSS